MNAGLDVGLQTSKKGQTVYSKMPSSKPVNHVCSKKRAFAENKSIFWCKSPISRLEFWGKKNSYKNLRVTSIDVSPISTFITFTCQKQQICYINHTLLSPNLTPLMTWISLNAGLPSQIPNLPRTEDRLSVSPKEATDLRDFLAELDQFPVNCAKEEAVAHVMYRYMHTSSCQLLCQPGHLIEHASAQQVEEMENSEATNKTIILPYLTHDFA